MSAFAVCPIADEALGNTSYVVDAGDGVAISVDPRRDAEDHLRIASERGLTIAAVLETHLHADFVSGAPEVAAAAGATIVAAAEAQLDVAHTPVRDGERLRFGRVAVEVSSTPGHTPEHISYALSGGSDAALFSGGSLIVGGAARTDLTGAQRTQELARAQYASLRRLATLPDTTALYPTHGAGSFCSTGPAKSSASTIGTERRSNRLFSIEDEDGFVRELLAGFGSFPRYFASLRQVNRAGAAPLASLPPVPELDAADAHRLVHAGAWLMDGRPAKEWARAHAEGSVSNELRPAFASWLGWVVPFGQPVVFMLEQGEIEEAARLARRIGYDRIQGWLRFASWRDAGLPVSSVEMLPPDEVAERSKNGVTLVDVRQASELESGRLPGAVHVDAGDIIAGTTPDGPVITYCEHGQRSSTAASLLERRGVKVANLAGGAHAWRKAGLPLERPSLERPSR
ncbi:MAG: rhodanese-like domain-containing protein [Actinomycetota bacterium]